MPGRRQADQALAEKKKLVKHKNELINGFKNQMKLIDVLKRQVCMLCMYEPNANAGAYLLAFCLLLLFQPFLPFFCSLNPSPTLSSLSRSRSLSLSLFRAFSYPHTHLCVCVCVFVCVCVCCACVCCVVCVCFVR